MSSREWKRGRGRKIRRRCGRLCGRCGRWIGRLVRYGYGSTNYESQNPHVSQKKREMGHPAYLGFNESAGAFWGLRREVCAGDADGGARWGWGGGRGGGAR